MVNNELKFDVDLYGNNFKSCFARSVAVNSQHKQNTTDVRQLQSMQDSFGKNKGSQDDNGSNNGASMNELPNITRFVKNNHKYVEESRRFSCHSATNSRRESLCSTSSRPLPNIPIENIMFQSQIDTLQWQLKQTEASREMYRAVMKQVVTFLERAHKSLEILGTKINNGHQSSVQRSRSEHQVSSTLDSAIVKSIGGPSHYEETLWKKSKKNELLPEEIPPEKLSQEAFRLLRTAQSILNTREPDLAHLNKVNEPEDDISFISQLAKEFPQENKSRITSFSLSPKLLVPDKESSPLPRINRKLSLYSNEDSTHTIEEEQTLTNNFISLDNSFTSSGDKQQYTNITENRLNARQPNFKYESEKSASPPVSSIGSTEDESGFSSMTSFQEVGLPVTSVSMHDETLTKEALLRSMLHDGCNEDFYSLQDYKFSDNCSFNSSKCERSSNSQKLWTKSHSVTHKRSSSTPAETMPNEKISMKVLWV